MPSAEIGSRVGAEAGEPSCVVRRRHCLGVHGQLQAGSRVCCGCFRGAEPVGGGMHGSPPSSGLSCSRIAGHRVLTVLQGGSAALRLRLSSCKIIRPSSFIRTHARHPRVHSWQGAWISTREGSRAITVHGAACFQSLRGGVKSLPGTGSETFRVGILGRRRRTLWRRTSSVIWKTNPETVSEESPAFLKDAKWAYRWFEGNGPLKNLPERILVGEYFFQGENPLPTVASARGGGDLLRSLLHWAASIDNGVPAAMGSCKKNQSFRHFSL